MLNIASIWMREAESLRVVVQRVIDKVPVSLLVMKYHFKEVSYESGNTAEYNQSIQPY